MSESCQDCRERIEALRALVMLRIDALESHTNERFRAIDKATDIQTVEVARRLTDLNGEAVRLAAMQSTYLPREVFDTLHGELARTVTGLVAFRDTALGRQSIMTVGISLAVGLAVAVINYVVFHQRIMP